MSTPAEVLRDLIGLEVDPDDALHTKLSETVRRLGPGATYGQRIVALRFDFAWELREAGKEYGSAKADYENHLALRVVEIVETAAAGGQRVALGLAEYKAQGEAYELKLTYLVAEQRERAMRKFLDALDAALENHRTDRADARAGDRAHSQGYGGGA
jgi:hypothetical protein